MAWPDFLSQVTDAAANRSANDVIMVIFPIEILDYDFPRDDQLTLEFILVDISVSLCCR